MHKLLIVNSKTPGFGGVETVIKNMMNNINVTSNIKIKLLMLLKAKDNQGDQTWCKDLNYEILQYSFKIPFFKSLREIYYIFNIKKLLLKEQPDTIFITSYEHLPLFNKAIKALRMKTRLFFWPHLSLDRLLNKSAKQHCIKYAHEFLAISTGIKKQLINLGVAEEKIHLIYNPVTSQNIVIPTSNNHNCFIYIGRLGFTSQKNLKEMIDAFALIDRPFKLNIIGEGKDRDVILDYIKSKGLEDSIKLSSGWIDDPWKIVSNVDAVILTSLFEGLPMVLLESLSRGIPCISSSCVSGPEDIIHNNITGYLYEPGDINGLKESILKIMNQELDYTAESLKASIDQMYNENYYQRVINIINMCD